MNFPLTKRYRSFWIKINHTYFERVINRIKLFNFNFFRNNIDYFLINLLLIKYKIALESKDFKSWKRILKVKYLLFEQERALKWSNDLQSEVNISSVQKKIFIEGPNFHLDDASQKEYDLIIILKPNKFIYRTKVLLLANHISTKHLSTDQYDKIQFSLNDETESTIKYPTGTDNTFSLMGLQRALYYTLKTYPYNTSITIEGFDLYTKSTYNRDIYPTLIQKSTEFSELSLAFFRHGIIGNFDFMVSLEKYYNTSETYSKLTHDEYLYSVWKNISK